ncbi:protein ACCELERATED CELL DEATH 6, partial [Capsella rubella]|uniref:protein ACCELERATED CELL DEATH 6 n=1 Tax=Capsella rubella TaxID=81985 RepID=UPI000CD50B8D
MFRFEMDSSKANLGRIEAQVSMDMSYDEETGTVYNGTVQLLSQKTLRSHDSFQIGGGGAGDTEPLPKFPNKLILSEIFTPPGEDVQMTPETFSEISDGRKQSLRSNGTPISRLKSYEGDSVLHLAAAWGHLELVKEFVSECPCLLFLPNSSGKTPLHMAASGGHTAVVETFVEMVTFASDRLCTEESEREMLNLYVLKDNDGNTPLHYAIEKYHRETALVLVKANKDAAFLGNNKEVSSLYMAVRTGWLDIVKAILRITSKEDLELKKFNFDSKLQGKKYLAHAALDAKSLGILDYLLREYPSVMDERDSEGMTCLSYAAFIGYYDGVCNLLHRSTNIVYVCDQDGYFPIHRAAEEGHKRIVEEFIKEYPCSKYLLNKLGQNVLHVAAKNGKQEVSIMLMNNKATEHLGIGQDVDGNTPLHLAVMKWHYRSITLLANGNYILKLRNKRGLTAWEIAESEMKPNYIFRERWTLALILYLAHSKGCTSVKSLTQPSEPDTKNNRDYVNCLLVVAALVATVTFAAGFTIPGGFNSQKPNLGRATLATNPTLWIFILYNILAMQSSVAAIGILIWAQLGDPALISSSLHVAMLLLLYSLLCMPLAFLFGVITEIGNVKWLIAIICIISVLFFMLAIFVFGPHVMLQRDRVSPKYTGYFLVTFMQSKEIFQFFVD